MSIKFERLHGEIAILENMEGDSEDRENKTKTIWSLVWKKKIAIECRKRICNICITRVPQRRSEKWEINVFKDLMHGKCHG